VHFVGLFFVFIIKKCTVQKTKLGLSVRVSRFCKVSNVCIGGLPR